MAQMLSFLALLALCATAPASPFAPHPLPGVHSSSAFFEGWFTRVVSHVERLSFSVIVGGFRPAYGAALTEVWVCLLLDRDGVVNTTQTFLDARSLRLTVHGRNVTTKPTLGTPAEFVWEHEDSGALVVDGDIARLEFRFPQPQGSIVVQAQLAHRVPWDRAAPDSAGPEGWLAGAEGVLPTHYYVQTLASQASFNLTQLTKSGRAVGTAVSGRGFAHQEANWGGTFPTAWVWAEGMTADGTAQLVVTAGEFDIAGITAQQAIVAVRTAGASWTLRSIDLDIILTERRPCEPVPSLVIEGVSRNSTRRMAIVLTAPQQTFSQPLEAPSHSGFSSTPGSVESYSATARVELFKRQHKDDSWERDREFTFEQGALEFGGQYIRGCINATTERSESANSRESTSTNKS